MKTIPNNQRGFAHIALVLIIVVVLGAIGFAGYKVVGGKNGDSASDAVARAVAEAKCEDADKNICKFQASWKAQTYYTVVTKTTGGEGAGEMTYRADGDKKFHLSAKGETPYEMIVIDNVTYTKATSGTWWKQTTKPEEAKQYSQNYDFDEAEDTPTTDGPPTETTTYKALGTEACGDLTCFKYEVITSDQTDTKEFIWFDTEDYQLRRTRSESKDGTVSVSTFNYDKISIKAPSPVKELAENQYIVPGQAQPQTIPDASSFQNSLESSAPEYPADQSYEE